MPTFEVQGPDGKTYEVDAPDMNAAMQAAQGFARPTATPPPDPSNPIPEGFVLDPETGAMMNVPELAKAQLEQGDAFENAAGAGGQLLRGVPFVGSFVDEAAGAIAEATGGSSEFTTALAREKLKAFEEKNPGTSLALNLAGGPAAIATKAGRKVVGKFADMASRSLPKAVAIGSSVGAAEGTIYGAGEGENPDQRLDNALIGGGIGFGLGGAIPVGGKAVKSGVRFLRTRGNKVPNVSRGTQKILRDTLADDGFTGGQGLFKSDQDMLLDGGPNLRALASHLATKQGPAKNMVVEALTKRAKDATSRINQAFNETLGPVKNMVEFPREIIKRRKAQAKPLYDRAYSVQLPDSAELSALMKRPAVQTALKKARNLGKDEGVEIDLNNFNVRDIDLVTRALKDKERKLLRTGANNEARIIGSLKRGLLDIADEVSPDFAQARKVFGDESSVLDAFEDGRNAFKSGTHVDEVNDFLKTASEAEIESYRHGARVATQDMVDRSSNAALAGNREFNAKTVGRDKFKAIFGDTSQPLLDVLESEKGFSEATNRVVFNSATAERMMAGERLDKGSLIAKALMSRTATGLVAGGPKGAAIGAGMDAANSGFSAILGKGSQRQNLAVAEALVKTGAGRDEILRQLGRQSQARVRIPQSQTQQLAEHLATFEVNRRIQAR